MQAPTERALPVLALTTLLGLAQAAPGIAQSALVIRDVTVIPMTGEAAGLRTVLVEDGRIEKITGADDKAVPKRARVIDGTGKFLIPGLIDAHVHVGRSDVADTRRLLDLFLLHGVTTVVNLEGTRSVLEWRERIERGETLGPTIVSSGPILYGSSSTSYEQGRRLVQIQADDGYDLVKVYNPLSADGYRGVIEEAAQRDMPVIGHAVRAVGIEGALAAGQHIAHMEELVYGYFTWKSDEREGLPSDVVERLDVLLDESQLPALAKRVAEAGIWVTPNLVAYRGIVEQTEDLGAVLAQPEVGWMPASMQRFWQPEVNDYVNRENQERFRRGVARTYPFLEKLTLAFHQAGVPLLAGTDVGIPVVIAGTSLHRELELMVEAGVPPEAALEAATRSAADLIERTDLGRITAGARANLVLLSADPREDIRNTRMIEEVVVAGQLFDRRAFVDTLSRERPREP